MVANIQNLVSLADRTTEERRKIASKGGKASGKARREKKTRLEWANSILTAELTDKAKEGMRPVLGDAVDDATLWTASLMQQVAQATKGDNQSFRNVNEIYQEIEAKQDRQEVENDEFSEAIDAFSISHKQLDILQFQNDREHDSLICDGAIRSGKTSFMMLAFVDWAMRNFKSKSFIILGKTVGSAIRNVVEPYMALTYAQRRYKLTWAASKSRLTVERGGVTNYFDVFGGADASSYQLIQGFTAAGCLIDEVALCHQSAVNQALARCSVAGSKYWFNCNPDSPHHWFYQEWILRAEEQKALHLHFKLADNPGLTRQVIERYERQYHGVFKQRYIDGEWVVAEGLVYQYEDREYTIEPEDVPAGGMYYLGCDYGITNPFACLLIKVAAGKVYVIDEYVFDSRAEGRRLTDEEHYVNVEKLAEGHNIQELVIDPSATSMKETIYRHDKFDVVDADNDVIAGIRSVDQALAKGDIKVSTKCQGLIREMGLYRWDDSKAKDTVIKEFDHCLTGDTLVMTEHGDVPIRDLVGTEGRLWSYDNGPVLKEYNGCRMTQKQAEVFEIETEDGRSIKCTAEHPVLTLRGWVCCAELTTEDEIICI